MVQGIIGVAIFIGGLFSSYYGVQIADANKFGDSNARISVLENQKSNDSQRFDKIDKDIGNVNKKIDTLLLDRGYSPNKVISEQ